MEEFSREGVGIGDSASMEIPGEGQPKRRGTGAKRKGLSGVSSSSSHSSSSKRLAKERILQSLHAYPHSGPVTRARQSPAKLPLAPAPANDTNERSQIAGVADVADRTVPAGSELDSMCDPVADPNFDSICSRESNVHVVPTHAGWFSWGGIHELEKQSMDSFFNGKSDERTEDVYIKIRNSIMEKYHKNPQADINSECLSDLEVGDASARQEIMEFLEHWGLINFHPFLPGSTDSSSSKKEVSVKKESISEMLYRFEVSRAVPLVVPKLLEDALGPQLPQKLFTATMFENLVRPEGPSVEYHCNSCSADCSRKRFHCQKQADFDLCSECFNDGKFGSGMTSADFILMEPAEVPGTGGGSWTDQETLLLLEALELYGENWNEIAEHVATKTRTQCILHFFQMPIEDSFLSEEADHVEKNLLEIKERENPSSPQSEDKKETENIPVEPIPENIPPNFVISALKCALGKTGSGINDGELFSFAEAGNPIMALVAFFVAIADHDAVFTASRSSLRAVTEESPGIQLAMRHCFALEHPPEQNEVRKGSDCQHALSEVSVLSQVYPSVPSGEGTPNRGPIEPMAEIAPLKDSHCTKDAAEDSNPSGAKQSAEDSVSDKYENISVKEQTKLAVSNLLVGEESLVKLKSSAVSALAAAAVNAKVLVDQEEDYIRHLTSLVIEKQLKKLEIKLGLFGEIEKAISAARAHLDRTKQRLLHERAQIIASRLFPSSSRSVPPPQVAPRLAKGQSTTGPRPSVSLTPQTFTYK